MFIIIGDVFQFIVHCLKKIAEYFGHFYLIFNIFVVKTNIVLLYLMKFLSYEVVTFYMKTNSIGFFFLGKSTQKKTI